MASVAGRFCIDRYEASVDVINRRGATVRRHSPFHTPEAGQYIRARTARGRVPQGYISQEDAATACAAAGKRLCSDDEWKTACKGKRPTVYPYGEEHVAGRCNDAAVSPLRVLHGADNSVRTFGMAAMNDPRLNKMKGTVAPAGRFSRCRNSYGLYDMVGNLHEWTANPRGVFRGGYYLDTSENGKGCDYTTGAHSTKYHDYSTGFRCCSDGPVLRRQIRAVGEAPGAKAKPKAERKREKKAARRKQDRPGKVHVVAKGHTLGKIAKRYRVTIDAICKANDIERTEPIRPGQKLRIPAR